MHVNGDSNLLKTKIVATVGPKRGELRINSKGGKRRDELFNPDGTTVAGPIDHGTLLEWFINAGVDVVRLNMTFASLSKPYGAVEKKVLRWLTANKDGKAKHVAVLGDLPGPKIRLKLDRDYSLKVDATFSLDFATKRRFTAKQQGASVLVNDQPFASIARVGGYRSIGDYVRNTSEVVFFIGDGKVILKAESENNGIVTCRVAKAGNISEQPGLTIKRANIEVPAFQKPDKVALEFLLDHGREVVAFIGVSFVRDRKDIINVRKHVENYLVRHGCSEPRRYAPAIIAKIETREAHRNIDEILDVADGVMVARGDLGLQLEPHEVPAIQKEIIRKCNLRGKPVITATQMLDSMEVNMEPTRAEAADVFNAIMDGTDAVMLSGETSKGKHPVQAIRTMVEIAKEAEKYYFSGTYHYLGGTYQERFHDVLKSSEALFEQNLERLRDEMSGAAERELDPSLSAADKEINQWKHGFYEQKLARGARQKITDRISEATCMLSEAEDYKAIIAPTTSGRTARMLSRFRPKIPIIGPAHDDVNARKLILSFGVYSLCIGDKQTTVEEVFNAASKEAMRSGYMFGEPDFKLLEEGDMVIATSGTPLLTPGTTNLIQIRRVERKDK